MELTEAVGWQGRTIACTRRGRGPDVVLCHGTPWSSVTWAPYAEALASEFTVHVWDMPGYGRSSKRPEDRVDLRTQAQTFAALLDHWGLEAPHVVAHDIGGAVSLAAHLLEGRTYSSLLLADVVAIPPAGSPFFRYVGEHAETLAGLPAYIHEAVVRAYVRGAAHHPLAERDLDALVAPWTDDEGRPAFYRQLAQFDDELLVELEQLLPRLEVPTTVVWAAEDPWIPLETGRRLAGLLPGAELTVLPGAGHLVQYDAPVALAAALGRWLRSRA